MTFQVIAFAALVLAAIPAVMVMVNLLFYRSPTAGSKEDRPSISVLIPARDEEQSIGACLDAVLASRGVDLEVIVMDDASQDRTASIVAAVAEDDRRVQLMHAPMLPAGWCGKQHACHHLSRAATAPLLAFLDADVRLHPDGLFRLTGFLESSGADLVSGIPKQVTGTLMEKMVVPLIHFVLLGFLPMAGMRWSRWTAFAAGCGQLFLARRSAYEHSGGHAAIRSSRHDGLKLPRAFRAAGFASDLCDATSIAETRMYRSAKEVWFGFAKNADEGMASPTAIVPWSILLAGGQVLPPMLLLVGVFANVASPGITLAAQGCVLAWLTRAVLTVRFRQSWLGAGLHPIGVGVVIAIQWFAWWRSRRGRAVAWKGRAEGVP